MPRSAPLLTPAALRLLTSVAAVLTAGFYLYFFIAEGPLAPYNSVSLQFAWTPRQAQQMFSTWGEAGLAVARRSLIVDFAFMPCYAVCLAGLVQLAVRSLTGRWQALGLGLSAAPWAAWAFDAAENLMLLRILATPGDPPALLLIGAGLASLVKFSFFSACVLYGAAAGAYRLWHHLR